MNVLDKLGEWIESTAMHQQIQAFDLSGLVHNPYFIVPCTIFLLYSLWKKNWISLFLAAVFGGIWYLLSTPYMGGFVNGMEIDQAKILPLFFGGAIVVGIVVVILFGRSE